MSRFDQIMFGGSFEKGLQHLYRDHYMMVCKSIAR